ncbi:MAG: hypothetical protein AAF384_16015 [Pseudomonadota bacterium]
MNNQRFITWILIITVGVATPAKIVAENPALAPLLSGLGEHTYPLENCAPQSQPFFDQGLRLFYGFRYPESLASFQEASRLDSTCAMSAWGEALAIKPTPNSRYLRFKDDPQQAGQLAIERAIKLGATTGEKQLGLINALAQLYAHEGTTRERDLAYSNAMKVLHLRFADDAEIATLYGEALMTQSAWDYWTPDGKPRPGTEAADTAFQRALSLNIDHPGANHLYIHLLEDSLQPELALPHAERLAATMPGVGHMVHMPSHIYVRTGLYDKSIDSNIASIAAAERHNQAWADYQLPLSLPSLPSSDRSHRAHANDFIHMAAVLKGDSAKAMEFAEIMARSAAGKLERFGGFQRRYVKPYLTLRRFGKWQAILSLKAPSEKFALANGLFHFVRASALINSGAASEAFDDLNRLGRQIIVARNKELRSWVNPASSLLEIARSILLAEIANADGNIEVAIAHYEQAIRLEDGLHYMEPPEWGHPVRQELGALLLANARPAEAETVFWEDLRRHPENGWSLHGVWQALLAQGRTLEAEQCEKRFETAWSASDTALMNGRAVSRNTQ